jgi:hypothetical protein
VVDAVAVEPAPEDIAGRVSAALQARWPQQFSISVGPQFLTLVSGIVESAEQRAAVLALVGSQPGVAGVRDATRASPNWRRHELQRFLDAKHWRFVSAAVRDDGSIQLMGVVANEKDSRKVIAELHQAFPDVAIQSQMKIWRPSGKRGMRSTPLPSPVRSGDSPAKTPR